MTFSVSEEQRIDLLIDLALVEDLPTDGIGHKAVLAIGDFLKEGRTDGVDVVCRENPGSEQDATRSEFVLEAPGEWDQQPGDQVGEDDIELALAARQAALACAEAADEGVPARVGDRRLDRDGIGVEPQSAHGAQLHRGDRKDP
jgi:hypothetical protein